MNALSFRRLKKEEILLIVEYRIIFLRELQGEQPPEKESKLRESLTGYFQQAFDDHSFIGWIAEHDAKPVGFGGMVIQSIPGNFHFINGREGYILSMYTIPDYRKKGVGSVIMDKLIEDGKQMGLGKIYLHASKDGIDIYRKIGFTEPVLPELELNL